MGHWTNVLVKMADEDNRVRDALIGAGAGGLGGAGLGYLLGGGRGALYGGLGGAGVGAGAGYANEELQELLGLIPEEELGQGVSSYLAGGTALAAGGEAGRRISRGQAERRGERALELGSKQKDLRDAARGHRDAAQEHLRPLDETRTGYNKRTVKEMAALPETHGPNRVAEAKKIQADAQRAAKGSQEARRKAVAQARKARHGRQSAVQGAANARRRGRYAGILGLAGMGMAGYGAYDQATNPELGGFRFEDLNL